MVKKDIDDIDYVCKKHCVFNLTSEYDDKNKRL